MPNPPDSSEHSFSSQDRILHPNRFKHGYVQRVKDWPYSPLHRYVHEGIYHEDWGNEEIKRHKTTSVFKRYNLVTEEELKDVKWKNTTGTMDTYMDTKKKICDISK